MSAHSVDSDAVVDAIVGRTLPGPAKAVALGAMGIGVLSLGYGFAVAGAAWTWGAFLVALVYVLAIAQGGVMFAVILSGTWGRWGRPLKRIGESFAFFLPIAWILLALFLVAGTVIYPWNPATILPGGMVALAPHSPEAWVAKPWWLTKGFFITRQLSLIGVLIIMDLIYIRASMRPDLIVAKARLGSKAPAWWDMLIGGMTDADKALKDGLKTQATMVPFLGFGYAIIFSLMAFDLLMSLSPWWFSNMFGGWIFVSSLWVSLATLGLVAMVSLDWLGLRGIVSTKTTHDLGMLLLALCMFWAYTTFAQLLPIWYTDMPEETDYLLVRMYLPTWSWLAKLVAVTCFLAPFTILLSRGIKKMRWPFAAICVLIMVGIFLERSLLVMPSVYFDETFPVADFLLVNVGILIGFLGMMMGVVGTVLASTPAVSFTDPYLEPHPWDVHVHARH
jgi:hypothetical protein